MPICAESFYAGRDFWDSGLNSARLKPRLVDLMRYLVLVLVLSVGLLIGCEGSVKSASGKTTSFR